MLTYDIVFVCLAFSYVTGVIDGCRMQLEIDKILKD